MAAPTKALPTRSVVAIALLIVAAVVASSILYADAAKAFFQKYWVDDAAISFTFVRHIAEGYGSVAYPGGERVEGFSNPSWVGLLVLAYRVGVEPFAASQYLGMAFAIGTLLILALFAYLPLGDDRRPWAVALAMPLIASNAGFAIWNQSGLENGVYGFLLAAALLLAVREARRERAIPWSALALFFLAVTRPEGVGHAALAGCYFLLNDLFTWRRPTRRFLYWVIAFGGLFGLYQLWHYIYFAWPLPNTYYAKVRPALMERLFDFSSPGWVYLLGYLKEYNFWPVLALLLPAFFSRRFWRESLYLALTAAYVAFFPLVANGDWMKSWRFLSYFPVPVAILLGLAGWQVGNWCAAAARRFGGEKVAAALAIAIAAAYALLPLGMTYPGSKKAMAGFMEDREVSAKGIAKRVKWWDKVADKAALRPADLLYCDMDMGGSSYNWTGRILDIGYLLDVPMARHRYTKDWRRMMDEYFFTERQPDLIHMRRGWGQATTVPSNPKFETHYLRLPEDRKFSSIPNGNFVRRVWFERETPPPADFPPFVFRAGVGLYGAEIPAALPPGRRAPIFLTWKRETADTAPSRFSIAITRPGQALNFVDYPPLMGWLPPAKWPTDRYLREVVPLTAPTVDGEYFVYLAVTSDEGDRQIFQIPQSVTIGEAAGRQAADDLLAKARAAAERDAAGADEAPQYLRRAEQILGAKAVHKEVAKIERQRLETYRKAAAAAEQNGADVEAAGLLARCWRIDARDKELNKLGWRLAARLYQAGRDRQSRREWNEAFRLFSAACQAQPQHAWARRRAEEVRMLRTP